MADDPTYAQPPVPRPESATTSAGAIGAMDQPAIISQLCGNHSVSNLMYIIWASRPDLQSAFDLADPEGQQRFIDWYRSSALREYGLIPVTTAKDRVPRLFWSLKHVSFLPSFIQKRLSRKTQAGIRRHWWRLLARILPAKRVGADIPPAKPIPSAGANLVGYAHGVLGMGEHVRMTAAALSATDAHFGIYDFSLGINERQAAMPQHGSLIKTNRYNLNIFHINADQMLPAYCHLGPDFYDNRYNIGFWAWELSRCPESWVPVISMIDEIWAPSTFIRDAFQAVTSKPVVHMPLCVELPSFERLSRSALSLPTDRFLFLFAFDFLSYIERKNPIAAISAFRSAFPDRSTPVGLVLKIMNLDPANLKWAEIERVIADDPRIHIISRTMSRSKMLALIDSCDSFVSLHRSEGFGRGPAEAMLLSKPVIVTNYSGNTDFTKQDNSCLVDYRLIDVEPGAYPMAEGQVWADPDIEHAAWHMRKLVSDASFARDLGSTGKAFIAEHLNAESIGARYRDRINEINAKLKSGLSI